MYQNENVTEYYQNLIDTPNLLKLFNDLTSYFTRKEI